jgi:2-iminobutanoate/2-iminopropanoate deaminase
MSSDSPLYFLQFAGIGACCALLQIGWAGGESHTLAAEAKAHTMKQIIRIPDAPRSPLYSQAVRAGSQIYVTGVPGIDPATNKVAGPTIQEQTRQALINCKQVLRAAGATLDDVVEVQVLLARPEDFAGLNEEYAKFFRVDPPVRSVARLGPDLGEIIVSIRMTAYVAE